MYLKKIKSGSAVRKVEQVEIREDGSLRLVVVSDTHSHPHASAMEIIAGLHPDAILHAGDVGELSVLDQFAAICPVYAVRGNIDQRHRMLPDKLVFEAVANRKIVLRILTVHVGVYGPVLRSEVLRMAQKEAASLIVCGHSHVPFIGRHHGCIVFNPGAMGPARNRLPVVFGILELKNGDYRLSHIDCCTGLPWRPPEYRT